MSNSNLKLLKEIILDEQRLITYISVSKELCMHVNDVKVLLKNAVEDIRNTRSDVILNVNFIIAGLLKENTAKITVCSEADLTETLDSFLCVFFHHIYSVCQGSSSVDNTVLASINNFDDFPLCIGLIKGTSCTKRTTDEIGLLKINSQDAIEQKINLTLQKDSKNKVRSDHKKNDVKIQETKSEAVISVKTENKEIQMSKRNGAKSNGIAGFLNRANNSLVTIKSRNDIKNEKVEMINETKKSEVKIESMDIDDNEESKNSNGLELNSKSETNNKKNINLDKNKKETKTNVKIKKGDKSINVIKKNAKVDKKRKRVLEVSDSESDEDKNDPFVDEGPIAAQDSDDEIPPTPSTSTVKITSGIVNPKKRRRIVDKTYTDEEGYILTRKEEVYESCSDTENDKNTKENIMFKNHVKIEVSPTQIKGKNSKKKNSPPQKGKQASIMNFFQRK